MGSEPRSERTTPWVAAGVGAAVGLVGLVVALAILAPLVVLDGLVLLAATLWLAWVVAKRGWGSQTTPRQLPDAGAVEALAEGHRAQARDRHAVTVAAVAAGLVPSGLGASTDG